MTNLIERHRPVFNLADAGGGTGGVEGDGGGGWTPPQGLPPEFAGKDANETLGKLFSGFQQVSTRADGLRTQLAQLPKAPDKPDMYEFKPNDRLKPYFAEDLTKDPVFTGARQMFHDLGVPADRFGPAIEKLFGPLVEQGILPQPFSPQRELKSFMEASGMDREAGTAALTEADAFAKGLTGQLKGVPAALKEQVGALLIGLTDTAAGNALLRGISGRLAENGIRVSGESVNQGGMFSKAELDKLNADPRIDPRNREHKDIAKRFDPDLRKRFDDSFAALDQLGR